MDAVWGLVAGWAGPSAVFAHSLLRPSRVSASIRRVSESISCVFCRIVSGELAASRVAESPTTLAFMDVDPVTPGHVLVIPKAHLPALADLPDAVATEMLAVARSVAAALRHSQLRSDGINLFYADGEAAFQEVFHAHLHVFPRWQGDGFTIGARWGSNPARAELDVNANVIRAAMAEVPGDPNGAAR